MAGLNGRIAHLEALAGRAVSARRAIGSSETWPVGPPRPLRGVRKARS